jgi:hypothetical protein
MLRWFISSCFWLRLLKFWKCSVLICWYLCAFTTGCRFALLRMHDLFFIGFLDDMFFISDIFFIGVWFVSDCYMVASLREMPPNDFNEPVRANFLFLMVEVHLCLLLILFDNLLDLVYNVYIELLNVLRHSCSGF